MGKAEDWVLEDVDMATAGRCPTSPSRPARIVQLDGPLVYFMQLYFAEISLSQCRSAAAVNPREEIKDASCFIL